MTTTWDYSIISVHQSASSIGMPFIMSMRKFPTIKITNIRNPISWSVQTRIQFHEVFKHKARKKIPEKKMERNIEQKSASENWKADQNWSLRITY